MENYTQHITRTRIAIPRKRADLISRQRLLDALDELLDKKVIIIAAPAGYGKTSLLIDLADDLALPVCWYSLDALDQNISRFLEYFVASIQVKFPEFKTNIINVLHSSYQKEVDVDAMVTMLVNDIYDQITEHFVIMLDDYHLVVEDTQINQFLSRFLQNVEENCHIVFASRTLLALPDLPLMVARGLVGGLGFEELAFTTGETRELFFNNHHIVLSDTEAETLCKQTEGWITGLLLTAQTSITRLQAHEKSLRATGININDYFELIYNAQPQHIQQFLLYTSLLEDFDFNSFNQTVGKLFPDLCKQYKACADHIFKTNLFVQSVGLDGLSLRYHHLFLDYLQQKVRHEQTETYEKLQDIIAAYYRQTQQWEKAYEIYRKEGQLEKQIALLEEASPTMLLAGFLTRIHNWLNEIPESILLDNPALCSLMGIVLNENGDLKNSLVYFSKAFDNLDQEKNPGLTARTLVRKATALRALGQYNESLKSATLAIEIVNDDVSFRIIRAEAYRIIGGCHMEMGNPMLSLEYLNFALEDYSFLQKKEEIVVTLFSLGTIYSLIGEYDTAKKHLLEVISYWEMNDNYVWLANALNNLGFLHHLSGNYESAVINLEKALYYCRNSKDYRLEAITLCSIGDIYSDLGALEEAINLFSQSYEIGKRIDSKYIVIYSLYSISVNYLFNNQKELANKTISEVEEVIKDTQSEYYESLFNFSKALFYFSTNQYKESIPFFEKNKKYLLENKQQTLIGRTLLYLFLAYFSSKDQSNAQLTYELLQSYLLSPDFKYTVLPVCVRENLKISGVTKQKESFKNWDNWIVEINTFSNSLPIFRKRIRRKTTIIPFAPARLEIITLGEKKVKLNDNWLTSSDWQTQSAQDLFFLILSTPNGLTKEEIGLLLWPDDSDQDLKYHFKNAVYRLRHAIGKDSILLDGDRYYFNNSLDYHYDAEDLQREIELYKKSQNYQEKKHYYKKITKLYKGDFLPTFSTEWIFNERNRLQNLYSEIVLDMAKSAFDNEKFSFAIEVSKKLIENDPCQEEAYRIAMQSQAANGNRMEVDRLYKLCEKKLQEELEAPPSLKTKKLHQTLMKI